MKVLIITPKARGLGGIAQHVNGLVRFLRMNNFEVEVLSSENTPILPIKGLKNPSFMITSSLKSLFDRIQGGRFDVIHSHNVPSVLPAKIQKGGTKVLTIHGVFSEQVYLLHGKVIGYLARLIEEKAFSWMNIVTVVSKETAEEYRMRGYRVFYIPNAIWLDDMPTEGVRYYDKQVVYVGRLSHEKGVDVLIRAFIDLNEDIHLLIIGDGPERNRLMSLAKGRDNIHFLGFKERSETLKIMKGSDVLVLPSRKEGLSTTLLEAMALKIPIIATRTGGNIELLEDGKNGILVDVEDAEAIRNSIVQIFENVDMTRSRVENAYNTILKRYNWNVVGRRYLEVYKSNF